MMNSFRLKYKLHQQRRQLSVISIITTLTLSFFFFLCKLYSTDGDAVQPVDHSESSLKGILDGNSSITLVVSSTSSENTRWIASNFPNLTTAVYIVDRNDHDSPFKTPMNKGNEAMVYLTYIIDTYESLPEVAIFSHAHLRSKHTDELLGNSIVESLRRLRLPRVKRDGYFNLRCSWKPGGCPQYLNLRDPSLSAFEGSAEAQTLRTAWSELLPDLKEVPEWVSQPYGGQFATTRDTIRTIPLQSWIQWREWLIHTDLADYHSGRVWEYTWQYVLTGRATFCPDMYQCYCEGYGICFGSNEAFLDWTERGETLEENFSRYLLMQPTGRIAVEMKTKLLKEKDALDLLLKEAKDGGGGARD
jgi:hypothetical protein